MAEFIDKEKILDDIRLNRYDPTEDPEGSYSQGWKCGFNAGTEHAIHDIVYTKPADVRPVRRGRWIGNKRHQSCSGCHMTYCVPDGQDGELDMTAYNFCPNCGADMGDENDG